MHLFLIKKKKFPPTFKGLDSFRQFSHKYNCLDLGRRTHNLLRTCFLPSLHGGRQPPNQGQPEESVLLLASRATARELLLLTQGGPSDASLGTAGVAAPGSPHLARLDHLLQGLHHLHVLVLHGQGEENGSVSSFLRHKCHQVLCKDMDERLIKGKRRKLL